MARPKRTSKPSTKRRPSRSQIALYLISLIVVLSIAIGFVIDSLVPGSTGGQSAPTPTPVTPAATATLTLTPSPSATVTLATGEPSPGVLGTPQSDQ